MIVVALDDVLGLHHSRHSGFLRSAEELAELFRSRREPRELLNVLTHVIRWRDLESLVASDVGASQRSGFEIAWRDGRVPNSSTYDPANGNEPTEEMINDFEDVVVRLFAHVESLDLDIEVRRGWAGHPRIPWEKVERWPSSGAGEGSYRGHAGEEVLAHRGPLTAFESMLGWLAGSRRPRSTAAFVPQRVAVTQRHVYAQFEELDGSWRLPLSALRLRRGANDVIYTFGRKTNLVLLARESCPVRDLLDRRLGLS